MDTVTQAAHNRLPGHIAAFYRTDTFFAGSVASFVSEGLAAGERVLVLATLPHWNAVAARLEDSGVAHGRAASEGRLILIDAEHVLDTITVNGRMCVESLRATVLPLITPEAPVRIYGELVSLLAERGKVDDALAVERIGAELARSLGIPILCGYHAAGSCGLSSDDIGRIQDAHDRSWSEATGDGRTSGGPGTKLPHTHAVQFYESRAALAGIVGRFLGEAFVAGVPAIVIATPEHRAAIAQVLSAHFFDVRRLEASGDLLMRDAADMLARFMVDGMPDADLFGEAIVPLIDEARKGRGDSVVRAYGEMVDVLWKAGETGAAVRLETLWNELARRHTFALLCGYSMGNFYKSADTDEIRRLHTHHVSDVGGVTALR